MHEQTSAACKIDYNAEKVLSICFIHPVLKTPLPSTNTAYYLKNIHEGDKYGKKICALK